MSGNGSNNTEAIFHHIESLPGHREASRFKTSYQPNVLYLPPNVDEQSDMEDFDDNDNDGYVATVEGVAVDISFVENLRGSFELEYVHCANPSRGTGTGELLPDQLSRHTSRYKTLASFGDPKWGSDIGEYSKQPVDVEGPLITDVANGLASKTPFQLFSMFLDEKLFDMITRNTNKHARQNNVELTVKANEMRRFIGILFLSGFSRQIGWEDYWSSHLVKEKVNKAMDKEQFALIRQHLYLADNEKIDRNDRFTKVRPFLDAANQKFMQFGLFSHNLAIGGHIIPLFGINAQKVSDRSREMFYHFGFREWNIYSADGYLFKTVLYPGGSPHHDETIDTDADMVFSLLQVVSDPSKHRLFFDFDFPMSYHLMCLLAERGYFATGSPHSDRIGGAQIPEPEKIYSGQYVALFDSTQQLLVIRWRNSATVTALTNNGTVNPLGTVKNLTLPSKLNATFSIPNVIEDYTKYRKGVAKHGDGFKAYAISIRGPKWWWPIFIELLDNMAVNAYKLHCLVAKTNQQERMPRLEFQDEIINTLMLTPEPSSTIG